MVTVISSMGILKVLFSCRKFINMSDSLKILNVDNSGFSMLAIINEPISPISDEKLLSESKKIRNQQERINYLKSYLEKVGAYNYIHSINYLFQMLKKDEPKYAYNLIIRAQREISIFDEGIYVLMADLAITNKAYKISMECLECAILLCSKENKKQYKYINKFLEMTRGGLSKTNEDCSDNELWKDQKIKKDWLLEMIYYHIGAKGLLKRSINLLNYFPENIENYMLVYKALLLGNDKEVLNQYLEYITENKFLGQEYKDLYTGLLYFSLNDIERSVEHLAKVKNEVSDHTVKTYLCTCYLLSDNRKLFEEVFKQIPPSSDLVLFFLGCAYLDIKIETLQDKIDNHISLEISRLIKKLVQLNKIELYEYLLKQFKKLQYQIFIPELFIYLAEVFIDVGKVEKAAEILQDINHQEVHRVNAWIHRIKGNLKLAEEELVNYRKKIIESNPDYITQTQYKEATYQLINIKTPTTLPNSKEEIMKTVSDVYKQTKDITNKIDLEYGIDSSTCSKSKCTDCCTKTFPMISYTEYLYLKLWLDKQPKELRSKIYEKSKSFVKMFKENYGVTPSIIAVPTKSNFQFYPTSLAFECPCLIDGVCSVYEARPFMCRTYSYTAIQGKFYFKGCSFFKAQFDISSIINKVKKLINYNCSFFVRADKVLIDESVVAPIPVWFATKSLETATWKAKYTRLHNSIFTPWFNFVTKFYQRKT